MVAVVDAASFESTVSRIPECLRQVVLADRIVVSKGDLIEPEAVARVLSRLREINPAAQVGTAVGGRIEPAFILEFEPSPARFSPVDGVAHTSGIKTFSVVLDAPVQWAGFSHALSTLTALRGPDLLRVKGLVNVQGCPGPVVIHLVQHLAHPPVELLEWPTEDRRSRIVFIVRNMTEATVRNVILAVQDAVVE